MILESVQFATRAEVADDDFTSACQGVDAYLADCPGFRKRQLYRTTDGHWVDLVWWDDLDSAQSAAKGIGDDSRCHSFMASIAPNSVTLSHAALYHEHP